MNGDKGLCFAFMVISDGLGICGSVLAQADLFKVNTASLLNTFGYNATH